MSMKDFEEKRKGNLYKIWNRLASGTYFPPAVREVEIPKKDGKMRKLGIPTVGDRIAQTVIKDYFDFLGYSFQPRPTKDYRTGRIYNLFDLAISRASQKKIVEEINYFRIHRWSSGTIEEIADMLYSKLQGWINYYGKFRKWNFLNLFNRLSFRLMQWVQNKYKITSIKLAYDWLRHYQKAHPNLFAHWRFGFKQ